MKIRFFELNTVKVTKGKWVGKVEVLHPYKADVNVSAESEFMAYQKTMSFFEDERKPASKVPNADGGYTYKFDIK